MVWESTGLEPPISGLATHSSDWESTVWEILKESTVWESTGLGPLISGLATHWSD